MKHNNINIRQSILGTLCLGCSLGSMTFMSSCDDNNPERENVPELITKATLTFTPSGGGATVVVTATDPDGEGVQDIVVDGAINLVGNKTYTLSVTLVNGLANPADPAYDITAEVEDEAVEHLFFYGWTNNVFADPAGDGNVDSRSDGINYNDADAGGLPLGLNTTWTSAGTVSSGTFRVILKHQPGLKSATSTSSTGETDLDVTFAINIQ